MKKTLSPLALLLLSGCGAAQLSGATRAVSADGHRHRVRAVQRRGARFRSLKGCHGRAACAANAYQLAFFEVLVTFSVNK
ncbi:hypothetical protein IM817_07490 [Serratia marcescens]|uniref:hypothetical protein n=1 Tax=Serratia marcescens TaxID=615 RepID=UPI001C57EFA7|nr:hypothetical protein [Serratia marcescens]QXX99346.1 hypothetical protein IM817_07490 [Serratia marcescens]